MTQLWFIIIDRLINNRYSVVGQQAIAYVYSFADELAGQWVDCDHSCGGTKGNNK